MDLRIKSWDELTVNELYDLMQLRSEVFVVEQACIYQDVDGTDRQAHHLMIYSDELLSYCRIFLATEKDDECRIGRVVVRKNARKKGLGKELMTKALDWLYKTQHKKIRLEAQTYLIQFYSDLGFSIDGEEYLEDGIPHISMVYREY